MIREWLESYNIRSKSDAENALREIMQEVALLGLERSGFFEKAAFYGGTALRIFYGLERFSEDLDFSLMQKDPDFLFEPYLAAIINEFDSLGMLVSIKEKKKNIERQVDSAFLKSETVWKELVLENLLPPTQLNLNPNIKIKLEVDTMPPTGFETEDKLLLKPYSFYVRCFMLSDLFAGKLHALLFRQWKERVKGRDWYDFEWYIKRGVPLNLHHFLIRAKESGNWMEPSISAEQVVGLLRLKIENTAMNRIREDIIRFIPDGKSLDIWSPKYFNDLVGYLKFQ